MYRTVTPAWDVEPPSLSGSGSECVACPSTMHIVEPLKTPGLFSSDTLVPLATRNLYTPHLFLLKIILMT